MSSLDDKPGDWVQTTLGEVCKIKYGKDHKKLKDGEVPCFGSGGIMRYVNSILYDKPSVLIPRKGTLSNLFYVDKPFWTVDTLFYTQIDEDRITPKYLFNLLQTYSLEELNVGSAVPSLTTNLLNQVKLKIPKTIKEQKSIESIISAFDDKIELLERQNITLEEIIRSIYKNTFGHYKIKDDLPNNWKIGKISDLITVVIDNRGKTPPVTNYKTDSIPLVEVNSIVGKSRIINIENSKKSVDKLTYENWFRSGHPREGDILFSTVGSIAQIGQVFGEKICIAQNIVALRGKKEMQHFLYEFFSFHQKMILKLDISSVQPSIKIPHLLNLRIVLPPEKEINICM